jgi:hypothetical protein
VKNNMNLYSVASLIPEDSPLGKMLQAMREKLSRGGIPFKEPKMGDHITYLPPFYAPTDFAEGFTKGVRFCRLFQSSAVGIEVAGCRYLDHDKRACALLLDPSKLVREVVEDLRISIRKEWWKYAPDKFTLLMHATAAESVDESFYDAIMRLPEADRPESVVSRISVPFPAILLHEKDTVTGNWAPVHF